ncbi:FxsA family protein [Dongia sp.]|uniref:FxsA family protein n=1 Tax=Dongia sp. TaxID=1977262 RepID=UPI0035B0F36F
MIRIIVAIICALPILEIAGFVVIGGRIGLGFTLLWLLLAGLLGLSLIRHGGVNALIKLQTAMNEGREPGHSMIDAAVMVTAGILLIVPGFVSDALALILLLPPTRNFLLRRMARHFETRIYRRDTGTYSSSGPFDRRGTTIIEGEFEVVEPEEEASSGEKRRPAPPIIDQRPE